MKGIGIRAWIYHFLSKVYKNRGEMLPEYLADASLFKVALCIAFLQGNMALYKKSHKEVHNPCYSNSTSGNISEGAEMYAHGCDKRHVMGATKQTKILEST